MADAVKHCMDEFSRLVLSKYMMEEKSEETAHEKTEKAIDSYKDVIASKTKLLKQDIKRMSHQEADILYYEFCSRALTEIQRGYCASDWTDEALDAMLYIISAQAVREYAEERGWVLDVAEDEDTGEGEKR